MAKLGPGENEITIEAEQWYRFLRLEKERDEAQRVACKLWAMLDDDEALGYDPLTRHPWLKDDANVG